MPTVYATVGISGSGKTTWAKAYVTKHPKTILIDTDELRQELWGDAADQRNGAEVFRVAFERMNTALADGYDVVFCATSTTRWARNNIREAIKIAKTKLIFVWFPIALEVCIQRNNQRDRVVPERIIRRQYSQFELFDAEEKYIVIT